MLHPDTLQYAKTHEWAKRLPSGNVLVGLTDFAQSQLGDIVYIALPETGDAVETGVSFGDVESVKTVSEMISPVTGTVCKVNEALSDAPERINQDCYGAWIIEVSEVTGTDALLSAAEYEALCAQEA